MQTEKMTEGAQSATARPGLGESARHAARREYEHARERLQDAAHRARGEAKQAGTSVSRLVMDEIDRQKTGICDGIQSLAETMRQAASDAERNEDTPAPPRLMHQAVNTLDDLAGRIRNRSAEELTGRVARFGRENPALFVAGALFAGLAIGRFLGASTERSRGPSHVEDWDDRTDWADRGAHERRSSMGGSYGQSDSFDDPGSSGFATTGSSGFGGAGTGSSSFGGTGSGSGTTATPPLGGANESDARDLGLGQGGVPQPGGPQSADASNLGGTGTAGFGQSSTTENGNGRV